MTLNIVGYDEIGRADYLWEFKVYRSPDRNRLNANGAHMQRPP